MDEAARKRRLVDDINLLPGAYARRLEDKWAVGLLDLIIKLPGYPWLWAEGKIIEGNLFEPTERQWVEGNRIKGTGTFVLLLGWKRSDFFISPWVRKANIENCYTATGPNISTLMRYLKEFHAQPR
jgi:hypothetical protein